jgi:beta-lysine 5,6-aminomutase beta subunit
MSTAMDVAGVCPYADHKGDGIIQMSFTLPLAHSKAAKRAALQIVKRMGLAEGEVVHSMALTEGFTYFVVYARCVDPVSLEGAAEEPDEDFMSRREVEAFVWERIGRKLIVVGASTGTDTHSLGIDAMLNLKGFDGDAGLEGYSCFETYNLGSQVRNGTLVEKAIEVGADAILVSQTVTQQILHIHNLTELADIVESQGLRARTLLVCGGPRISDELAKELGYDAGFSKGCYPHHLASFIARRIALREGRVGRAA